MKRSIALLCLLAAACSGSRPAYSPEDPLSQKPRAEPFYEAARSTAAAEPGGRLLFRALVPEGYRRSEGRLTAPVVAVFSKDVYEGEAAIVVERYSEADGNAVSKESFLRNLNPRPGEVSLGRHSIGGRSFEVYHGIEFTSFDRRIQPNDPYADALGAAIRPPRLSLFERRRFPPGGNAYRLYRCRKLGAWGLLGDYRRLRAKERLEEFQAEHGGRGDRRLLATCFGSTVAWAVAQGETVPRIPKPSRRRLRIMAREEWTHGASRRVERECVHLRDIPGGFLVLRFRAARHSFRREHEAFETFLSLLSLE
ncbi:MAG: hypothetical protein ABII00_16255 [Elusimicrobiota bacterium]